MRTLYKIHQSDPPACFYNIISEFLVRYDMVNTQWKGCSWQRPDFIRPVIDPSAPSSSQPPPSSDPSVSHKRSREVLIFNTIFDSQICPHYMFPICI